MSAHSPQLAGGREALEFRLGEATYLVDIEDIEQIAEETDLTPVPDAPRAVEGVMDLRGRTTTIVDPKVELDITESGDSSLVLVFDPATREDGETIGWAVDEVNRVVAFDGADLDAPPASSAETIEGILQQDDEFKLLVDPQSIY